MYWLVVSTYEIALSMSGKWIVPITGDCSAKSPTNQTKHSTIFKQCVETSMFQIQ